jgi:hypothetical protein
MTKAEKYPDLWRQFQELRAKRDALEKEIAPARAEHDAEAAKAEPHVVAARKIYAERIKPRMPELASLDQQLSALSRAMGGAVMVAEPPK